MSDGLNGGTVLFTSTQTIPAHSRIDVVSASADMSAFTATACPYSGVVQLTLSGQSVVLAGGIHLNGYQIDPWSDPDGYNTGDQARHLQVRAICGQQDGNGYQDLAIPSFTFTATFNVTAIAPKPAIPTKPAEAFN